VGRIGVLVAGVACLTGAPACRFGVAGLAPVGGVGVVDGDMNPVAADLAPVGGAGGDASRTSFLSGSAAAPAIATDLTAAGPLDWAHWGLTTAGDFDHRAAGDIIPNFAVLGGAAPLQFTTFSNDFSWSDGTPHASASATHTGVYTVGQSTGFTFDVPASHDDAVRLVRVFAGNYNSTARFTASFADGSAPAYTADLIDTGFGSYRVFSVRYRAAATTHLHLSWQQIDGSGNIALEALTVEPGD
jgi:hypothetical protein